MKVVKKVTRGKRLDYGSDVLYETDEVKQARDLVVTTQLSFAKVLVFMNYLCMYMIIKLPYN